MAFPLRRARITGALTAVLALTALIGPAPAQAHDGLEDQCSEKSR
ncbi:putative membrane protein [Arthrobacter sp. UYNi723]